MKSYDELQYSTIKFTRVEDGRTVWINLYSHYTCVTGDSGVGKTCFFEMMADSVVAGDVKIESEYPIAFVNSVANLITALDVEERRIIMMDESNVFSNQDEIMRRVNSSHHLFLCIGRTAVCNGDYPLQGIYSLEIDGDWFSVKQCYDLNVSNEVKDIVVTEAGYKRSEHELLSLYFNNSVPCGGRNRIPKKIRYIENATVFADLGNIGRAYTSLKKVVDKNKSVNFYDYQSFEQLLVVSDIVGNYDYPSVFDYTTIETMFEVILEQSGIGYVHGGKLPDCIINASVDTLFNNSIGLGIFDKLSMETKKLDAF